MNTVIDTDVLVVGAGPIGLAAACLLADQGVRVVLVEKRGGTSDEPRAISITDESLRVLQQIGIMDRFADDVLLNTGARYYGRKGQLLAQVRPGSPRLGQPGKSQFDQPVLESLLLQATQERGQIDIRFNTEAFGITDGPDQVETVVINEAGKHVVRSKWVVACDGGRSPVRAQLGIPMEGSTQVQKWIVVDVINTPGEPEKFAEFHCNGKRPAVVVPGVKGRRRYEFMLLPGEDAKTVTAPEAITAMIAPFQQIVAGDIRRAAVYVAHQRVALNYRVGHVLLAGDAAHMMPPFAGQALNAGIRDVANLAWKVAAHVRGHGTDALVSTYQSERRPHAVDMVRLSQRIGKVVMNVNPVLTALRDGALAALGIVPAAKNWLTGMKFLKQPHFTDGCVIAPAPDVAKPGAGLVGRSLSQPKVQLDTGDAVALDTLLGSGWAVLRFRGGAAVDIRQLPGAEDHSSGGPVTVTDTEGAFAPLHGTGTVLIVRPDRYVAAAATGAGEQAALSALSSWVPGLGVQPAAAQQVSGSS
ncbi:FAD-dependent monooxygenase [Arthrobacter mobilis]|uniref:FAD-dependent oxidoreductase n=1 Tax=Arthrobacter mobilis TaxID=2724944 RepID=A0A7X6K3E4_9MICC|nr:FAD-dependent monooxygenase [Arthrobacter mobilis]NKX54202.1 FAD-dependent oxidoreductase [Arthrobacter mobilis]